MSINFDLKIGNIYIVLVSINQILNQTITQQLLQVIDDFVENNYLNTMNFVSLFENCL